MGLNENKEVTMANVKLGTKSVGSIVKIKVNGASKDFIVVQQTLVGGHCGIDRRLCCI